RNSTLWHDQSLGRPITGTPQTLDALARNRLAGYLRDNYLGTNLLIVAAGRLKHRNVLRNVARYARLVRSGVRPKFAPARNEQSAPRAHPSTKDTEQSQIARGLPGCSPHDERRYALRWLYALRGE